MPELEDLTIQSRYPKHPIFSQSVMALSFDQNYRGAVVEVRGSHSPISCSLAHPSTRPGPPATTRLRPPLHRAHLPRHRARLRARLFPDPVSSPPAHPPHVACSRPHSVLGRSRKPLGYVDVPSLKSIWESGSADPVSRPPLSSFVLVAAHSRCADRPRHQVHDQVQADDRRALHAHHALDAPRGARALPRA